MSQPFRSRSHTALAEGVSTERIAATLDAATAHERSAVRSTILHNVLSGRVAGLIHTRRVADIGAWLPDYARCVHAYFLSERGAWQTLLRGAPDAADDPLLAALNAAARQVLRSVRLRYAHVDIQAEELINEAYVELRLQRRLLAFPFDVPLERWLRQCIWDSAKRLFGYSLRNAPLDTDAETMRMTPLWDQSPAALDDDWLSAMMAIRTLIETDQRIVIDMLNRTHASATARTLDVSLATVYARRKRIIGQLQTLLREDGSSGTDQSESD